MRTRWMCPRGAQMDTSSEVAATDTLGRRRGPRTAEAWVSVALVARRHEVNANQIFSWRRMYRAGLLDGKSSARASQLLPVKIAKRKRPPRSASTAVLHPESPICSNSPGKYTVTGCPPTDRRLISNSPWTGRPFRSCTITPRTLACSAPTRAFAARGRPRARAARRRVL